MKTGLVLEGGAMRGLFTAGVMDGMLEHGIDFDGIIGVSAGSSFGCNYKSRQPGRVLRYNLRFHNDPRYMGLKSLITSGDLVGAEFAYHTLPLELDKFDIETFENNPTEFYSVSTDVDTGAPVYYKMTHVTYDSLEWLRASASMPAVTRPVTVSNGKRMLDGGISDAIPLAYFQSIGYDRNVVVLTQPNDYEKKPAPKWLFKLLLRRYPKIADAMINRHIMYNEQLRYVREETLKGNTFVIAPSAPLKIGRVEMKPDKMKQVYETGRETCISLLPSLKKFLGLSGEHDIIPCSSDR